VSWHRGPGMNAFAIDESFPRAAGRDVGLSVWSRAESLRFVRVVHPVPSVTSRMLPKAESGTTETSGGGWCPVTRHQCLRGLRVVPPGLRVGV